VLALLLLADARRAARVDAAGALVALEAQDRDLRHGEAGDAAQRERHPRSGASAG
jgi:predicted RNA polymerase sigma factor